MGSKFSKSNTDQIQQTLNLTHPMPVTCKCCGFELPEDAEKNSGYFVNFLSCRDKNRENKIITGVPSMFMDLDAHGNIKGSSSSGYHLKENFTYVRWVVLCIRCHANKSRNQAMHLKTNNLETTGQAPALSIESALKKLRSLQNMRFNS